MANHRKNRKSRSASRKSRRSTRRNRHARQSLAGGQPKAERRSTLRGGFVTLDLDYYDRLTGEERVEMLERIKVWAEQEINRQQRWNKQADDLFNRELGIKQ